MLKERGRVGKRNRDCCILERAAPASNVQREDPVSEKKAVVCHKAWCLETRCRCQLVSIRGAGEMIDLYVISITFSKMVI